MTGYEDQGQKRKGREEGANDAKEEKPISPPPLKRRAIEPDDNRDFVRSPFQLTTVRDLPEVQNVDTVSLHDLLGDPLIHEAWLFDFMFDVDFVMQHFDEDVRHMVTVKIVHGSWRRDDENRIRIEEGAKRWRNVRPVLAFMPELFGTHHSKMMILLRHDETAQVIIHTANMISQDWANFTQAVWQSPRLPLLQKPSWSAEESTAATLGSGLRFKKDLLRYLAHYGDIRTGRISTELKDYDFDAIRAALIASVPTRDNQCLPSPLSHPAWGWVGLRDTLQEGPRSQTDGCPLIVAQVSSIGTLSEAWIDNFERVLSTQKTPTATKPDCRVMFPTADEVRRSLDGYAAGASIHMRVLSDRQQKMLPRLKPHLVHWVGDARDAASMPAGTAIREAGRRRAAPHIKTYTRFSSEAMDRVDWAMVTSANLSTQAWGDTAKSGNVRVCSYEIGVLVWPDLLGSETAENVMVPTFKRDTPTADDDTARNMTAGGKRTVVGLRMPYDTPLVRYGPNEAPWVATTAHTEPDWKGETWTPS